MNPKFIKHAEWTVAILLSATVLFLLLVRATHAGALWRDECDSVALSGDLRDEGALESRS